MTLLTILVSLAGMAAGPAPRIVPALHIDATHITISVDSFPWRDAAPLSVRQIEGVTVDSALRAVMTGQDDGMGSAYFPFLVSLTDSLRSLKYVLVHAGGVTPLRPDSLKGTMGMTQAASSAGPVRLPPSYTGDMHLSVPRGQGTLTGGGFLLISARAIRVTAQPSRYTADDLMSPGGADYFARGTPFWNILAQFAFRVDDDPVPYVFVQWAADKDGREGYCEFRFALFRFTPQPTMVATSDYGCDV